jgi:hypothetical protein
MNATQNYQFEEEDLEIRDQRGRLQGDENLKVKFFKKPELSTLKSQEAGRPIYDELDFVLILIPGDQQTRLETIATEHYKKRFPVEWKRYQDQNVSSESGTPLSAWGMIPQSQVAELAYFNITTVEALAELDDYNASKFMGGLVNMREKAKRYIQASKGSAELERQNAELAKRDAEIAELRRLVEEVAATTKKKPTAQAAE